MPPTSVEHIISVIKIFKYSFLSKLPFRSFSVSKIIIEAYHFLVSIATETREKVKAEYLATTTTSQIADFYMDKGVLYISFADGSKFEYFGVPRNTYVKMVNAESPGRFARRHIFNEFTYRSASKLVAAE